MPETVSSNHFSVDQQMQDALDYLRHFATQTYDELRTQFPEIDSIIWAGSWIDTNAMGVDPEWSSWLIDAIEETGLIYWEEGEPWTVIDHG